MNANGESTGDAWDGDTYFQAFVRTADGTMTTFGNEAFPVGINDSGTIVGYYFNLQKNVQHGFLRAPDGTITRFDPPRCSNPYAVGIDAKGDVTGYCSTGNADRGFLRSAAGKFKLFDPPGSTETHPASIARIDAGTAVTGLYKDGSGVCHGFLRTN